MDFRSLLFGIGLGGILGFVVFYFARLKSSRKTSPSDIVLISVVFVWSIAVLSELIINDYSSPSLVNGLMGALVGFYFPNDSEGEKNGE